ncbi:uncharacterized protein LOC143344038 isoform X2 [Colletes latitarsis]|uniref:uncharacterized protein LOC143344038 isoform X2 n=1 Tax=Colletes latitarsis TaxID=2605962 RepID=UPI004035F913
METTPKHLPYYRFDVACDMLDSIASDYGARWRRDCGRKLKSDNRLTSKKYLLCAGICIGIFGTRSWRTLDHSTISHKAATEILLISNWFLINNLFEIPLNREI